MRGLGQVQRDPVLGLRHWLQAALTSSHPWRCSSELLCLSPTPPSMGRRRQERDGGVRNPEDCLQATGCSPRGTIMELSVPEETGPGGNQKRLR